MFTKLDMVDSHQVLTNLIEWLDDDVISDVTTERFWLEFSVFGICEYHNLISLHPIFTKLDMVDNQPLFMNFIGWLNVIYYQLAYIFQQLLFAEGLCRSYNEGLCRSYNDSD